ncbi:hypothetical protein BH10PSE14_BH10PSE14_06220 [soil metagenome]
MAEHDADGFRRVPRCERSPGLTELMLPGGRTFSCVGTGGAVEQALVAHARAAPPKIEPRELSDG